MSDSTPAPATAPDVTAAEDRPPVLPVGITVAAVEAPVKAEVPSEPVAPVRPAAEATTVPSMEAPATASAAEAGELAPVERGVGILLVNLGTPDAAKPAAGGRYLKQFLSDPRVIEKDTLLWKFVLNGFILPIRSRVKARDYEKIW